MATSTSALARRASALGPRGAAAPARVLIPTSRSVDEGHAQAQVYTSSARNATWKFHPGAEKGEQSSNFSSSCTFLWVHGGSRLLCGPRPLQKGGGGSLAGARERLAPAADRYSGLSPPVSVTTNLRSRTRPASRRSVFA